MALLDRVKERVETDLSDEELERLIDEAVGAIVARHGPHSDDPVTVTVDGGGRWLHLPRRADPDGTFVVVETRSGSDTTLEDDDWQVVFGGWALGRLSDGTNQRSRWASRVEVTFDPWPDGNERQETTIQLVQLAIQHRGLASDRVGDQQSDYLEYTAERDRLLDGLDAGRPLV